MPLFQAHPFSFELRINMILPILFRDSQSIKLKNISNNKQFNSSGQSPILTKRIKL